DPACRRWVSQLELRDDLRPHQALELRLVVVDLDYAIVAAVDRVELGREADPAAEHRDALELDELRSKRGSLRRAVSPLDRQDDAVDRVRSAQETTRAGRRTGRLERRDHRADGARRIVAEDRGVR